MIPVPLTFRNDFSETYRHRVDSIVATNGQLLSSLLDAHTHNAIIMTAGLSLVKVEIGQ